MAISFSIRFNMPKPVVLVLGCSGFIGFSTVRALSQKYSEKLDIRAGTRNPDSDKMTQLKSLPGVMVLQADMSDHEALRTVLTGVMSLFIVTPTNGINLAITAGEVAKSSGVTHILTVSVLTVELIDSLYGKQYSKLESSISSLGIPYTLIRLPPFVDNYWSYQQSIRQKSFFSSPGDPNKTFSAIVVEDAGKAAAAIMAEPGKHFGKTYKLISNSHTLNELATTFSEALGREVKYQRVSYQDTKHRLMNVIGFSENDADGILEIYKLTDDECPLLNEVDMSHFSRITGEEATSLKDWVNMVAPSFK